MRRMTTSSTAIIDQIMSVKLCLSNNARGKTDHKPDEKRVQQSHCEILTLLSKKIKVSSGQMIVNWLLTKLSYCSKNPLF